MNDAILQVRDLTVRFGSLVAVAGVGWKRRDDKVEIDVGQLDAEGTVLLNPLPGVVLVEEGNEALHRHGRLLGIVVDGGDDHHVDV